MDNNQQTAFWVIPATKEPWRKGYHGICTHCQKTNDFIYKAPPYCQWCGSKMKNGCQGNG